MHAQSIPHLAVRATPLRHPGPRTTCAKLCAAGLVACLSLAGCSSISEISKRNGRSVNGEILGRVDGYYIVRASGGTELVIAREDVADIDRPGNVAAVLGALLGVTGLGMSSDRDTEALGTVFILGGIGVVVGGLYSYFGASRSEVEDLSTVPHFAGLVRGRAIAQTPASDPQGTAVASAIVIGGPTEFAAANTPALVDDFAPSAAPTDGQDTWGRDGDKPLPTAPDGEPQGNGRDAPQPSSPQPTASSPTPPGNTSGGQAASGQAAFVVPPARTRALPPASPCPADAAAAKATADPPAVASSCVASCLGKPSGCVETCIRSQLVAPSACVRCYAARARCEMFVCAQDCQGGSTMCASCVATSCANTPETCMTR